MAEAYGPVLWPIFAFTKKQGFFVSGNLDNWGLKLNPDTFPMVKKGWEKPHQEKVGGVKLA